MSGIHKEKVSLLSIQFMQSLKGHQQLIAFCWPYTLCIFPHHYRTKGWLFFTLYEKKPLNA